MRSVIDGAQLGRRFMLGTTVIVLSLVLAAALGLSRLSEQERQAEIALTLSRIGEGLARVEMIADRALSDPRAQTRLAEAYVSLLRDFDALRHADPAIDAMRAKAEEIYAFGPGRSPEAWRTIRLDSLTRRWLPAAPPDARGLDGAVMSREMLALWRGDHGAPGLEQTLAETLAKLESFAMRNDEPSRTAIRHVSQMHAEAEAIHALLARASALSASVLDRRSWTGRAALVAGCGLGALAALLNHLLVLRPLRRRLASDHAILALSLERARAGEKAKSQFLSTMSHELRTPLNGVLGMASLLDATGLTTRQHGFVETIRQSSLALLGVIEDILIFTQPDLEKLRPLERNFALGALGAEPVARLSQAASLKGVAMRLRLAPGGPEFLRGDRARLDQVLLNLLGNAVKFTDHGEIALDIATRPLENGRVMLRAEVRDTGRGVPYEQAERIFSLFHQADQSETRRGGGAGLGLTVCNTLMRLMGGRIGMRSGGEGEGATFWIEVDLPVGMEAAPLSSHARVFAGRRAMLIGASPARQRVSGEMFGDLGMSHQAVADAAGALAILDDSRAAPPDLILLDHQPPAIDAEAIRARIRTTAGGAAAAVIVLKAPGSAAGPHPEDALAEILIKPATIEATADAVAAVLDRAAARSDIERAVA
jgi:signal transduction histidine kinase